MDSHGQEIILGIDPGFRKTGFGIIRCHNDDIRYVSSGFIDSGQGSDSDRLKEIYTGLEEVINQYRPDSAGIEKIFFFVNPKSALKLGQARGVALLATSMHNVEVCAYSAKQIKQAVAGYGAAEKGQMNQMIKSLLKLKGNLQSDAADALGIALCHYYSRRFANKLGMTTKTVHGRLRT